MIARRVAWVALLLGLAMVFGAVGKDVVSVVDSTGSVVEIPQPVERVASVYGIGTYYLYALGVGDRLVAAWYVGVKAIDQAPPALARLESRLSQLLSFGDPNVEDLAARGTELVLADASRHSQFAQQMAALGVPVLLESVETPEGVLREMSVLGQAFGLETSLRAVSFGLDYTRVLAAVEEDTAGLAEEERPRVLFLGTDRLEVASGEMYQTRLIEAAGGTSVSQGLRGSWQTVNLEQILVWNPDVILIPSYSTLSASDLLGDPDWQAIRAVKGGRVYVIPRIIAALDTPVPESLLGLLWMERTLYPGRATLDLATEARHFYTTYYGYLLSDAELDQLTTP